MTQPVLDAYLIFDGTAAQAMKFYEKVLGARLEMMMTFADSPMGSECGPGDADKIMHACLDIGGRKLMASDEMPGTTHKGKHGVSMVLSYDSVDEAKKVFAALSEGGTVNMPMDKTFWVESFGMATDRFGTAWMINGGKAADLSSYS